MEKKKKRTVFLLAGTVVILLAVYIGIGIFQESREKKLEEKAEAEKIYVTDLKEMSGIRFDVGNGQIELKKEADTWYDAADQDFPLSQTYPQQMADTFEKLEADRKLEDGDELADYGLEDPAYTVILTDSDGTETTLYFGNVTGEQYYLTRDDKTEIYTVSTNVIADLQYTLEDMAQLDTLPAIGSGNLKKAVITENGKTVTYTAEEEKTEEKKDTKEEKDSGESSDSQERSDAETDSNAEGIATIAGGLGAMTLSEAADYSAEKGDLAQYGLDESSRITEEITYTEDGEEQTLMLYFGKTDGNGRRYMMINDSKIVYTVTEETCKNALNKE